MENLFR
ncbi:hypothetical protein YPPY66_2193, partial [Yersinia pestis PY-66]